jgi:hypothetical protein
MPRDSRGRYTASRPRLVGSGRRLRIYGADFGTTEVGGVISGEPIVLGGAPEPEPKKAAKGTSAE